MYLFIRVTDAFQNSIGAVLSQVQDDQQVFGKAERNYSVTRKQLLDCGEINRTRLTIVATLVLAWAMVSALYFTKKDSQRVSKYPHYSKVVNLKDIVFPMTIHQIPRFEKQNYVSINVYILKKARNDFISLPTYLAKKKRYKHVNLLLIQNVMMMNQKHQLKMNEWKNNKDKKKYQIHIPAAIGYYFICSYDVHMTVYSGLQTNWNSYLMIWKRCLYFHMILIY